MTEQERQERLFLLRSAERVRQGRLTRRQFVRCLGMAGLGITSLRYLSGCGAAVADDDLAASPGGGLPSEQESFLRQVGGSFRGTRLRIVSENTAPTQIISKLAKDEFTPLTGIEVDWEIVPLDQVLSHTVRDTLTGADGSKGLNDVYYWDQAWLAKFANDSVHLDELLARKDLAYPDYDFDDFLPQLVEGTATYRDAIVGIPYDIPIFIMMYRKDIFEDLGLTVPRTMADYMSVVKAIDSAKRGQGTYGTVGQRKAGHYSLQSETSAWLWSHGGQHFDSQERPNYVTDANAAGLEYALELGKFMDPASNTWDWDGQFAAFAAGKAGIVLSWSEFFPGLEDPAKSQVVGLVEPADCPLEVARLTSGQCGHGEIPGISRQGGSCLALSRYAPNTDAAWIFMQWATSADVTARANALGSNTPTRASNYVDARVTGGAATTRHFGATRRAIENRMGTSPRLPVWPTLASDVNAVEFGKLFGGQQSIAQTLRAIQQKTEVALASG